MNRRSGLFLFNERMAGLNRNAKWMIVVAAVTLGLASWGVSLFTEYFDRSSISHTAIQDWLKWICASMYEYHSKTGRWPAGIDDLAETTLPARFPLWRETAKNIVFLWPKDLQADPKENAGVILAYYNAGLISEMGRVWVCWGDLRTEYIRKPTAPGKN